MHATFVEEVRHFVVDNFLLGKDSAFSNEASLLEEGIMDSTGVLQLVSYLEETYEIEIPDEELNPENLDSINRIAAYICRKLPDRTMSGAPLQACAEEQ